MKKKNMTAAQALMLLRQAREVRPNVGFLQQLGKLDNSLRAERYRKLDFWNPEDPEVSYLWNCKSNQPVYSTYE